MHHTLAAVLERQANHLAALREYQRAADLDGSESNIFDLGTELLVHRAALQACDVFARGARSFPRSTRMLLALAAAFYSRGLYEEAKARFFEATDLNPGDPAPYLLLGEVESSAIAESDGFAERMERFVKLHPDNAWANYYYAASLLRRSRRQDDAAAQGRTLALLQEAIRLDPKLGDAWLELGILYADRYEFDKAISAWQRAIAAAPRMEETHYRLAQAYRKTGEPEKAKAEMDLFEQLSKQSADEFYTERGRVKQFVFEMRDHSK